MRFRVPQFLDIKDKIFGPFTFLQFVYMKGGAGGAFALWKILPSPLGIIFAIPLIVLALLLTFYKINNKPFIYYLEHGIRYFTKGKLFIWKKPIPKDEENTEPDEAVAKFSKSNFSESKLQNIAWSLDVMDKGDR